METTSKGFRYIFLGGIVFSFLSKDEESTILLFLRSCTIIVHLLLNRTRFPANANSFIACLISIVMFDFLDIFDEFNLYYNLDLFEIDALDKFRNPLPD